MLKSLGKSNSVILTHLNDRLIVKLISVLIRKALEIIFDYAIIVNDSNF